MEECNSKVFNYSDSEDGREVLDSVSQVERFKEQGLNQGNKIRLQWYRWNENTC